MDTVHDLCLIEGVEGLDALTIGSDQDKGDYHYAVGHPGLRQLTVSQGEYIGRTVVKLQYDVPNRQSCPGDIIEIPLFWQVVMGVEFICLRDYPSLATTAVIYPGNSGSPVVNKFGNLIGVAFAGSTQQERDNFIVPLRYVKALLSQY
jgi:S1-C subfamily serine protease